MGDKIVLLNERVQYALDLRHDIAEGYGIR